VTLERYVGSAFRRTFIALTWLAVISSACHPQVRLKPDPTTAKSTTDLRRSIDSILSDQALGHGIWGVLVRSLKSNDTLYELNARKLFIPASNMKTVTLAAAAERLGWDFAYETRLLAAGRIDANRLDGDLVIVGSGDPSIVIAGGEADRLFDDWAAKLSAAGIRVVSGRLIGDDNAFDDEELGFGWSWDDLPDDYAAGVSALQFNESTVRVTIAPGPGVGDVAAVSMSPGGSGLSLDNDIKTTAAETPARITAKRLPGSSRLVLRGSMPLKSAPATRDVSVDNPTQFFVNLARSALIARGIDIRGPAVDIDDIADAPPRADAQPIASHKSAPLSQLAVRLMKISQNLYAETMFKSLGAAVGMPTFVAARTQVMLNVAPMGVADGDLIVRDGSGLSRYDFVSPAALVSILTYIHGDDRFRDPFLATLPIAGRDGSLSNRMKATPAENNARGKTGSMTGVRTLSGYVTTADGEPLVFATMANNFETTPDVVNKATDAIVVKLAEFRRSPTK
jgi:D-alanyl-D-alanine carboxypeptidase/D-alanyl-D-alanine-endopeptidase (penicillin-binding protein 4)